MIWRPLEREPDAISEFARAAILKQVFPSDRTSPVLRPVAGETFSAATLPDGREARLSLAVDPSAYRVEARLAVDLATRAVLACNLRLQETARADP